MLARRVLVAVFVLAVLAPIGGARATSPGVNGRIAFTSSRDGNTELFSMSQDGTAVRRLTWTADYEAAPKWSPDGTQLVYDRLQSTGGRGYRIWLMNADASGAHEISPPADPSIYDMGATWSPDGTQVAFGSTRGGNWNVWIMNLDGTGLRRVTAGFGDYPAWSPDGRRIAYTGQTGIGVVDVDGSNEHLITAPGPFANHASWSPDGHSLVFNRNNSQGYPGELSIVNADGSGEHQLTSDGAEHTEPTWAPDGTQIAFSRAIVHGVWAIWALHPDGTGPHQISTGYLSTTDADWGTSQLVADSLPPDAPTIVVWDPAEGGTYFQGVHAEVRYFCVSNVAPVLTCTGSQPSYGALDVAEPGLHTLTILAIDMSDRVTTKSVTYNVIATAHDTDAPDVQIGVPAEGGIGIYEQALPINVSYSCADPGGVASCRGDVPNGAPLDTSHPGVHTFSVTGVDSSGNTRTVSTTYTVLYVPPPSIRIDSPFAGVAYNLGSEVAAAYSCLSESVSLLTLCEGSLENGAPLDTSTIGSKQFTVRAADGAGRTTVVNQPYDVVYTWGGFYAPVDGTNTITGAKAGEALPLRFSMIGDHGLGVVVQVISKALSCADLSASDGPQDPVDGVLSYNASTGRYLESVTTDRAWKGTCRSFEVQLDDRTRHAVRVRFGR